MPELTNPSALPAAQEFAPQELTLHGSVLVLLQFDVCEAIRLDALREILGARTAPKPQPRPLSPAPVSSASAVEYDRPPVVEPVEPLVLASGERLTGQIKYYDYGVLSIVFELPFSGGWSRLAGLASRWAWDIDFAAEASRIVRDKLTRAASAIVKPYQEWLNEDYLIFHIRDIVPSDGRPCPTVPELIQQHGARIAQVVRGDTGNLAESEVNEVMQSRISYYANDLAVIGWNAAFLFDSASGAETAIQLLEYANSQLLEFRHYDDLLTEELERVYLLLDQGTGTFARWRLARSATRLHTVLLDVDELTEHADNAIKFLSDMFSARFYKLAAQKIGVPDYKDLVTQKVRTAEELYRFMVDQFNQSRAFFLELTVVIILVIELVYLFRGKPF
ncbi:hypothetical protein [Silvibacterium dinghuense]|uniref:DUF155 domain-containing protein n=1 Tax=Silvibacterium dinghuense TaxID=1560006 RepID=A0A4Q1SL61_9BACT|nr:hypothetical protein [Silvibacterium dinghuense]RXS98030.1 hypothetical protein ESZ00_09360 [Silvibacterium dinghuense]GGH03952.1 hypothetical protein GCM10011586_19960 [Silvibacterium dinghuense]